MRGRSLLLLFAIGSMALENSAAQTPVDSIPAWVQWRVFYERLAYFNKQGPPQRVMQSLSTQFGLNQGQAASLLNAGDALVRALERIDDDAKAEGRKRYPDAVRSDPARPALSNARPAEGPKSIKERAIADGLFAEVEARKRDALADHLAKLGRDVGAAKLQQITTHVQTTIASRIRTFAAPSGPGTRGLPPGLTRPAPTVR